MSGHDHSSQGHLTVFRRKAREAIEKHMPRYWYARTGRHAPVEVQMAIARFRKLPEAVRSRVPLLWYLLGESTAAYKMTQNEASYGPPQVQGQVCGNCVSLYQHVTTGTVICSQVAGTISPAASCRLWKPPISPAAYAKAQERE